MKLVKKPDGAGPKAAARKRATPSAVAKKAKGKKAKGMKSGLSAFFLDVSEKKGRAAFSALTKTRGAFRGFAAGGAAALTVLDAESAALNHLNQALESSKVPQFTRPTVANAASEFKSIGSEASPLTGTTVVKFRQTFNKVPVYGSLVTVELDKGNECLAINSSLGTPKGVNHLASVAPSVALDVAAKSAGQKPGSLNQTPRLYYYFDQAAAKWLLAWIIENVPRGGDPKKGGALSEARLNDYVVDAHTAKLIAELPRTATMAAVKEVVVDALNDKRTIAVEAIAGGKREMRDLALNVTTCDFGFRDPTAQDHLLPGTLFRSPPAPWPLEAIGAHANGAAVAHFLRNVLKRNNIDNQGGEMISSVNCWDRSEGTIPARQWQNAYWNGDQMVYGQIKFPDGSFFSVASMLDVVGHEMFHGVTDYTSRLEYRLQPGALNESYSDVFGVIIANFAKTQASWNWEIGSGFFGPGKALRNLKKPELHGQPRTMAEFIRASPPINWKNDYGHVHDNSGIHNYAAYRVMISKSSGKYLFTPVQLAAMFYVALTVNLSRTSQFADSRRAVLSATRSLFRSDPPTLLARKVRAVERAYSAAGIL